MIFLREVATLVIVFFLGFGISAEAKVYLVAVGISDYPGTKNDLRLCANDAQTIAWLYGKNSDVEVKLLLDSNATVTNIVTAMNSMFAKAGENDIVVFFFSGHGVKGGFVAHDNFLYYDKVRKAMSQSKSKSKIIFADACFSGKIRTGKTEQDQVAQAKKSNVMLFLSSRSNEKSIERPNMKNGFFTTYLQRGLRGGADANRDRIITAKELYDYVHPRVVDISKSLQHPVMWGNFPDDMTVIKW